MLKAANNKQCDLFRVCREVRIWIRGVEIEQIFIVQNSTTYQVILEQSCTTTMRIEIKVLDDDFYYTRIKDRKKLV